MLIRPALHLRLRTLVKRTLRAALILLALAAVVFAVLWYAFPFPEARLLPAPPGPVVTDRQGGLLLTRVSEDEQWRQAIGLPEISPWVRQAVVAAEDKRFYSHPGVDVAAVTRAAWQDAWSWHAASGASTITMQVCRMMDNRPRTLASKSVEAFRALQLERLRSKDQILELYLNRAPFGGNVCGIEAAALRYMGKHARDLSLAEAALLAGIPQSPNLLRPDRHPGAAKVRRDEVLRRMVAAGLINADQCAAAMAEQPVLQPPVNECLAPHAAQWALQRRPAGGRTTIDPRIQRDTERLAVEHARTLPPESDVAVVVIDIPSGDIVALVGSVDPTDPGKGQVNGALARRSPGSALKPFVYAAAFEGRRLLPDSPVYDVPITRGSWSPADFDRTYVGATTVADALRRSLNVPAILVAEEVGVSRCVGIMESTGLDLGVDPAARSGLSVVVGTSEVRLVDLTNAYATLGRGGLRQPVRLFLDERIEAVRVLGPAACAAVDHILSSRARRPRGLEAWRDEDVPWFMWKTGTSSGRRDAWAVGHNGKWAVGVWVGSFSGQGRAQYLGHDAAEPLLAELFTLPALRRQEADPVPPASWALYRPIGKPVELSDELRITSPSAGAAFLALDGRSIIRPKANRSAGLLWFLNGTLLEPGAVERLVLAPGQFELRCVDSEGQASAVRFDVR